MQAPAVGVTVQLSESQVFAIAFCLALAALLALLLLGCDDDGNLRAK